MEGEQVRVYVYLACITLSLGMSMIVLYNIEGKQATDWKCLGSSCFDEY